MVQYVNILKRCQLLLGNICDCHYVSRGTERQPSPPQRSPKDLRQYTDFSGIVFGVFCVEYLRLLLKPRFHFARLSPGQCLGFTQKLPIRTKGCLAIRVIVQIFYRVKPLLFVTWLASSQLLRCMLWTLISKHCS